MGLYGLQIRNGKEEQVLEHIRTMGITISHVEDDEHGTHYFLPCPKRKKEFKITISKVNNGTRYLTMGLTPMSSQIVKSLEKAGIIEPFESMKKQ